MAAPVHYLPLPGQSDNIFDGGLANRRGGFGRSAERDAEVASQFEAMMIQQWLKQARQASGGQGPFDSDQTRFAQGLADEQMAMNLAQPGIGLAQALLAQIRGEGGAAFGEAGQQAPLRTSRRADLRSVIGQGPERSFEDLTQLIEQLTAPVSRQFGVSHVSAVSGAPGHIQDFVARMAPAAQTAARESGLPIELILGQAALESGWGKREILHEDGRTSHNLFGIKATGSWSGKVVDVLTTEFVDGKSQKQVAAFRAYDSYVESFRDYARLLGTSGRYQAVREAATAEQAAQRVQEAGYATDPQYAEKLVSVMRYFQVRPMSAPVRMASAANGAEAS